MTWWYVARAAGIVALLLAGMSVVWGLLLSGKFGEGRPKPAWLLATHKFLGALTVSFTGVHLLGLVADNYVHFGWRELLIPFASTWNPVAVAFGVVAFYLLVAVQVSSLMMKRLPRRLWRAVHLSSFGLFWLGLLHGAMAGSDAANPLYLIATVGTTIAVLFLTVHRLVVDRGSRRLTRDALL